MRIIKLLLSVVILSFVCTSLHAKKYAVQSPDGSVSIEIKVLNQELYYRITKNKNIVVDDSRISWSVDSNILGSRVNKVALSGGRSRAINNYNAASYKISSADLPAFFMEVRVFDQGVAFRYSLENRKESEVNDFTSFVIPSGTKVWLQDNLKYYEGLYTEEEAEKLKIGQPAGPPVVMKYPSTGMYAAISEAGLYDFAGMGLEVASQRTFRARLAGKTVKSGNIQTPWRVIMVGSLNTLVNTDMIANLSDETPQHLFADSSEWLKPGKCVWSWMTGTGVSFENMKKFSQLAGELSIGYNLVDEGWSYWKEEGKDEWDLVKELVDYSARQNVKIWLWKAYPDRKGIPGIQTPERRSEFFKKCKEAGVVGLKIDFFDNESQETTKYYRETLHEAAKYGLMINFHGCNKPTGLNSTYPNEMVREGIRGYEYGMNVDCNVTLPFTRLIVGHGDYTPMYLNERQMGGTTVSHQIATAIAFSAPLTCLAAHPADILKSPNREFISSLPTVWDETVVLPPSEIGKIVLLAKRNGNDWYIAGMTKEGQSEISIDLSFLKPGSYTLHAIKDDPEVQNASVTENKTVTQKEQLSVEMNPKGGFVAKLEKIN